MRQTTRQPWAHTGTTTERGYGAAHQKLRAEQAKLLAHQGWLPCARCPRPILPGQQWHLDHTDDRTSYLGPSHRRCNELAAARRGGLTVHGLGQPRRRASRDW